MIRCLITGKLHDTPQSRTSATGNTFAVAKIKADDKGGAWVWVSVIAFGEEAERLLTLKAGDAVPIARMAGARQGPTQSLLRPAGSSRVLRSFNDRKPAVYWSQLFDLKISVGGCWAARLG